jgi:hypothetical protein
LPENTSYRRPSETISIVTEVITGAIVEVVTETIEDLISSADVIRSVSAEATENASAYAAENAGENASENAVENASAYASENAVENATAYADENADENADANADVYADLKNYTVDSCRCTAPQSWRTAISSYDYRYKDRCSRNEDYRRKLPITHLALFARDEYRLSLDTGFPRLKGQLANHDEQPFEVIKLPC